MASTQTLLLDTAMSISSFGEDEQGELYVVDLNGSVSRIVGQPDSAAVHLLDQSNPRDLAGRGRNR